MKIALVTNILTPYRKRFYDEISAQLQKNNGELRVYVMTNELPLRPWNYNELKSKYTELVPGKKLLIKGQDILFNNSINKRIKKFEPDVIILAGSWTYPTSWKIMLNKLKSNTKYYFWTESHMVRATKIASNNVIVKYIKMRFYKLFDGFCIPGKYANDTVNSLVGNYGERYYLPNLVDDAYYEKANEMRKNKEMLREKYKLPNNKRVFITPARLIEIKGVDLFLENICMSEYVSNATFVLAGEGPLEKKIKSIAKTYGIDVRMMGYCDQEQVRELYAAADFFLLPSLKDPNPLTVIEAAFSGLPLIISNYVGNGPELGEMYENRVSFDIMDREDVIEKFEEIMKFSDDHIKEYGKNSLDAAQKSFKCVLETEKFIKYLENNCSL